MPAVVRESAAIVLDCRDHGESDKIVTFFTQDRGRITGIAKGANRSKKRFVNKLELFSSLTIMYSEKPHSTLAFISEAELHAAFIHLRTNIHLYNCASILREVILLATAEREGDGNIYHLLLWSLQSLDEGKSPSDIVIIFLLRLYDLIGYRPEISSCNFCTTSVSPEVSFGFHHMAGGLICSRCRKQEAGNTTAVSLGTIRLLQSILSQPLEKLHRHHFSKQALSQSLTLLHKYSRHLFQREIHSWKSIAKLTT